MHKEEQEERRRTQVTLLLFRPGQLAIGRSVLEFLELQEKQKKKA